MAGILKQTGFAFQMIGIVFLEGQARIENKAHIEIVLRSPSRISS